MNTNALFLGVGTAIARRGARSDRLGGGVRDCELRESAVQCLPVVAPRVAVVMSRWSSSDSSRDPRQLVSDTDRQLTS